MKNKIPDGREWEKIVDEAFSSDRTHVFSEEYNTQKRFMRKGVTMKKNNILMNMTVAVATLAVVAFPTAIYLNTRTDEISTIPSAQFAEDTEENTAPPVELADTEIYYSLNMGWLPDGMSLQAEDSKTSVKSYGYSTDELKLTVLFLKNTNIVPIDHIWYHDNTKMTEEWEDNKNRRFAMNYNGSYDEETADPQNFGREIFVAFNGTDYMVHIFVTDDVSKDDLKNILDGLSLSVSDTETAREYTPDENELVKDDADSMQIYRIEYEWLPDGFEIPKSINREFKFHNEITGGGITPIFVKNVSGEKLERESEFTVLDEYQANGRTVEISYRDDYNEELASPNNYGRIATVYFDNTPYVLSLWVTDEMTKDDLKKIIENVKLVPTKFETATIYPQEEESDPEPFTSEVNADDCTVYQIGDEIYEPNPDKKGNISVKVNSVRFQDNLDGLDINRHRLTIDPNKYLDENGKIVDRKMDWFNEDFEVEDTISLPCHVMVVNLTYTNHDDETIDYMIGPQINHKFNGVFDNENPMWIEEQEKNTVYASIGYDLTQCDLFGDFTYFSISSEKFGEFDDVIIEPNESAEVQLAFVIRDDMRDNLYLNINGYLENNSTNLVDLSNLE